MTRPQILREYVDRGFRIREMDRTYGRQIFLGDHVTHESGRSGQVTLIEHRRKWGCEDTLVYLNGDHGPFQGKPKHTFTKGE